MPDRKTARLTDFRHRMAEAADVFGLEFLADVYERLYASADPAITAKALHPSAIRKMCRGAEKGLLPSETFH